MNSQSLSTLPTIRSDLRFVAKTNFQFDIRAFMEDYRTRRCFIYRVGHELLNLPSPAESSTRNKLLMLLKINMNWCKLNSKCQVTIN